MFCPRVVASTVECLQHSATNKSVLTPVLDSSVSVPGYDVSYSLNSEKGWFRRVVLSKQESIPFGSTPPFGVLNSRPADWLHCRPPRHQRRVMMLDESLGPSVQASSQLRKLEVTAISAVSSLPILLILPFALLSVVAVSDTAPAMRITQFLPLVAVATAFVIPDEQTLQSLSLEPQDSEPIHPLTEQFENFWEEVEQRFENSIHCAKHRFDEAAEYVHDEVERYTEDLEAAFAGDAWLDTADEDLDLIDGSEKPPHHGPPHHGPPGHKRPHHGPPNATVYELISKSKYTTKLAKLIDEFDDLVELLNGTKANVTVFAPTDKAFEKIPKHAPKPSKETLKKLLTYHVSPEFYPAGRVLVTRTIPTALAADLIGDFPQRLSTQVGLRGLTVNFYSRIVAIDIFGTNGVIHGVDSILLPPPKVAKIITAFPGEFSTLELALVKTDLFKLVNDTSTHHGGTLFAPSNFAFQKLGPRANAFLFSSYGLKYLKALLLYHVADNITLYSDAIYRSTEKESDHHGHHGVPKGLYHIDLPTGLEGKSLSIDVARYGRLITIKINGFTRVSVSDGIAADGVIHVVPNVLIPPKTPGGPGMASDEITVQELKERLSPFVEESGEQGAWYEDL